MHSYLHSCFTIVFNVRKTKMLKNVMEYWSNKRKLSIVIYTATIKSVPSQTDVLNILQSTSTQTFN